MERFYAIHSTFYPHKQPTKSGMDLTVCFDFKDVCAPPPLPCTLHATEKDHGYYLFEYRDYDKKLVGIGTTQHNKTSSERVMQL